MRQRGKNKAEVSGKQESREGRQVLLRRPLSRDLREKALEVVGGERRVSCCSPALLWGQPCASACARGPSPCACRPLLLQRPELDWPSDILFKPMHSATLIKLTKKKVTN